MLTEKMLNELTAILNRKTEKKPHETIIEIIRKYEELKRKRAGM
jgi:hypothetical protein